MDNKKVLWVNPSFLDYRIPLYENINDKLNGNFHLIYSGRRVPLRCINKVENAIGSNAINFQNEKSIKIGNNNLANKGIIIPFTKGLYKLIGKIKPDIIISEGFFQFTPISLLYAIVHRIPFIIAYERTAHTERNCPLWRRLYRRFISLFTDGYIVNGKLTKEYLISQGCNPNGIFTGAMCADSIGLSKSISKLPIQESGLIKKEIIGATASGLVYLYVGRIIKIKGVNYLLESWNKHIEKFPEDKLLIAGNGPLLEEYRKKYPNNSIIYTDYIDYSEIYKYYAISDVFIIPTLEDNWSLVVPEAMACGLPIACSIYNGCYPELVKENFNGRTFDPLNNNDIIETLAYFHKQDLVVMGKRSIEIEKEFSPEKTAHNIINAINIISNNKR